MRKINFLFLCLFSTWAASGQIVYSENFADYEQIPCPFDDSKMVQYPKGWYLYQTTDNTWQGPADSTRCISTEPAGPFGGVQIDLTQIDPQKALFIRAKPSEFVGINDLESNYLYNAFSNFLFSDAAALPQTGTTCTEDLCTGLFVGIGTPGPLRIQTGLLAPSGDLSQQISTCFPTEYFPGQQLKEIVLKFTFPPGADLTGKFLTLFGTEIVASFLPPGLVSEVNADASNYNATTGEYNVNVAEAATGGAFADNFILQYTAPAFPSASEPSYVVGSVTPNVATPQTINLVVIPFQTIDIQPFTYLIGAPVAGSDTLRHQVNLVNDGGDICLNFVDFVVGGGGEFRHGGGSLYMNNAFSCMQFRHESALRVLEGATLHYGNEGAGMLALCAGSTIALERDATLIVDCILNIAECNDAIPPQQIYMDLPPGARLVFTDRAHLTNRFSQGQQMHLNVHMLGGAIDDAALSPEDRELIRRIYPEPSPGFENNVNIAPNPFAETFALSYLSGKAEDVLLRWTSVSGQFMGEQTLHAERGMNEWQPETPAAAGVYFLSVEGAPGKFIRKMVKVCK